MTKQDRPNILWISTHDTSAWNYGCYGDRYAQTPNIDRLAAEGVRYANAFTAGPICSPSRTSIYTGMHPTTLGTHHHRSAVIRPAGVELLPKMLTDAGYACTEPDGDINLYVSEAEREQYYSSIDFWEKRPEDKPFFSYYKLGNAHASVFKMTPDVARQERSPLLSDDELHDPDEAPIPSFVPDTPLFRERMALFYDALTNVDKQVGEILDKIMEHPWKKTLRTKDFRYSVSPGRDEGEELFDLRTDPDELENLVGAPAYQEVRQKLKNEMLHRVMLRDYPLPPRDLVVLGAH